MVYRFQFLVLVLCGVIFSTSAQAIPAFARKYGTSCQTCHVVYPKLTPFGEAFRRDGYRFPGVDGDFVKQETVPLGQDSHKDQFPNSVWPGTLPSSVPIAVGFNGQGVFHPQKDSSGGAADNGSRFTLGNLIAEGHVWAGGSFDDKTTFFGELTFSDAVELEQALVIFNDLVGPKHAVNLRVGKDISTISSFGSHSTYVSDMQMTGLSVTSLFGSGDPSWNTIDKYAGLELNGVVAGRLDYSLGINAGANVDTRPTQNLYGHIGYKFGGMSLDGEETDKNANPEKPWAENSLTPDFFLYRSASRFTDSASAAFDDTATTFGGGIRAQWQSLELTSGLYQERHNHAQTGGGGAHATAQYNEISYVVFPWLVPALRVEWVRLSPSGGNSMSDLRIIPGVAALIRPNMKVALVGQIERATGAPDAGWEPSGGSAAGKVGPEVESISANLAFAF